MNRRQRKAVFGLYRTLLRRRWHRLGPTMRSLAALLAAISAVAAACAFVAALWLGLAMLPSASPAGVIWTWDGVLLAFLFFRLWGVVTSLSVPDALSMQNFLHLPLAPSDVFVLNTVAMHLQPAPLIFGAALFGLSLASVLALGPGHVVLLPLALASFWCVLALTRQLQTFLATLMVNKRRRGTITVASLLVFMLLIQAPNIYLMVADRDEPDRSESASEAAHVVDESSPAVEPSRSLLVANLAVPPAWLAYGAYEARRDRFWPAAVGTLGLLAITGWSLRRSYRSALRVYRRRERGRGSSGRAPTRRAQRRAITDAYWGVFPAIPAAIGRAALRQWIRSPNGKHELLTSIIVVILVLIAALGFEDISAAQPYLGLGLAAFCSFSSVVFVNNIFGWDRGGLRVVLAAGPARHLVLLGKHLGLVPVALGFGAAVLVVLQILWPQSATHFLGVMLQLVAFCLVLFIIGNHFSITAPWAASFTSLKHRGGTASSLGAFFAAVLVVLVMMLVVVGALALERLVADAAMSVPVFFVVSVAELACVAAWYRHALHAQAESLREREERILEAINTPSD